MILINLSAIREEQSKINGMIEEYEKTYHELMNLIIESNSFWHDSKSKIFFDDFAKQKSHNTRSIDFYCEANKIYSTIIDKYSKIAKKNINLVTEKQEELNEKYNECIKKIEEISSKIMQSSSTHSYYINNLLNTNKNKINTCLNNLIESKHSLNTLFKEVDQKEKEIKNEISKIDIPDILEFDISKW